MTDRASPFPERNGGGTNQDRPLAGAVERGWGTQIRSYVYYDNRVKDHRTNEESTDYERVLRGEVQPFIDPELQRRRKEKTGR